MDELEWQQRHKELRDMWMRFDPIGVMGKADSPDDEYETYVHGTMSLLQQEAPAGEIVGYISSVYENMGLEFDDIAQQKTGDFVRKVRDWYDRHNQ